MSVITPLAGTVRNGLPEQRYYRYQGTGYDQYDGLQSVAELAADHLGIGPAAAPKRRTAPAVHVTADDADPESGFDPPEHPRDQAAAQRLAVMDAASAPAPVPCVPSRLFATARTSARRKPRRRNRCRTCGYQLIAVGHRIACGVTQ